MEYTRGALAPKVDTRDYEVRAAAGEFPSEYCVNYLPKVKNQKNVSSCVAHAMSSIIEYFIKTECDEELPMSTDFIYGMQGVAFGRKESGMYLRDACKIVKDYGDAPKELVPGNTEQPKCTDELEALLSDNIYEEALINQIRSYAKCKTANDIKHALMNYGPVLASVKWYDKYSFNNGVISMDQNTDYGYHAIMIYGWNEQGWLCQNSWGKTWNKDGRFIYPFGDKLEEAWSIVDAENEDVYTPKNNSWLNVVYKIINFIINAIKGMAK